MATTSSYDEYGILANISQLIPSRRLTIHKTTSSAKVQSAVIHLLTRHTSNHYSAEHPGQGHEHTKASRKALEASIQSQRYRSRLCTVSARSGRFGRYTGLLAPGRRWSYRPWRGGRIVWRTCSGSVREIRAWVGRGLRRFEGRRKERCGGLTFGVWENRDTYERETRLISRFWLEENLFRRVCWRSMRRHYFLSLS